MINQYARLVAISLALCIPLSMHGADLSDYRWEPVVTPDGSELTARHEAAAALVGDALFLIGGRGNRPVERFSRSLAHWENLGLAPLELHHFQPVTIEKKIYVIGAFTCCYPREVLVRDIHVFDTEAGVWSTQGSLPEGRVRGSAAAVVRNGKIFVLGGNTQGHDGGAVAWFDEYDPATGQWRVLADAPNARDHFAAVVIGNKLIAAAGRQTRQPSPAANPVLATDVYDFDTGQWTSIAPIPTARGGVVAVAHGSHVVVAGGEINTSSDALDVVEAFNTQTSIWETWPAMDSGRHGSGGGIIDGRFYMFSGATTIGGANESRDSEFLDLPDPVEVITEPEPEVEPEPEIEPEPEPDTEPQPDFEPEPQPGSEPDTISTPSKSGSLDGLLSLMLLIWVAHRGARKVALFSPSV